MTLNVVKDKKETKDIALPKRSSCCDGPVQISGKTTLYYTCMKCLKACDLKEKKKC